MTIHIPTGYTATLIATGDSKGEYWEIGSPGNNPQRANTIESGDSVIIGPFDEAKNYELRNLSILFTPSDAFDPVPVAFIDDIAIDADGAEIALAVNSILAALESLGLMEPA